MDIGEFGDWIKGHETLSLVAGAGGAALAYYLYKKQPTKPATSTASQDFGTTNINGEPGVIGFVGPGVQGPGGPAGATGPAGAQGPAGSGSTPTTPGQTFTWKPTGALAVQQSPGGMVWYAAYKGTASDPNLIYINEFNRSGQLIGTINEGCANKDTPGGELCVLGGKLYTGGTAASVNQAGQGGPLPGKHLGHDGPAKIQPFGTVGSFLPASPLNIPRRYQLRAGDTAAGLGRRFYGKSDLGSRLRGQGEWREGETVKVW